MLKHSLESLSQSLESLNHASPTHDHMLNSMADERLRKRMSLPSVHGISHFGDQNTPCKCEGRKRSRKWIA